jgi:hypothetical protein
VRGVVERRRQSAHDEISQWEPFSKVDHRPLALTGNGRGFFVATVRIEVMSGSIADEAFLATQEAYAVAHRKMLHLYAGYADVQPNERVELWLTELVVDRRIPDSRQSRCKEGAAFELA